MKISQKDVILIKNLYLSKQYGARTAFSELLDKGWKLGSIDSVLKKICKTGTVRSSGEPCAQSGGQAKKHQSKR